jgi:co-chaperonin GroES (HSP10)
MRAIPKKTTIVGRLIDVKRKGTIILPDKEQKVTQLLLVDAVGPDVKECKVGDVICYLKANHFIMRDGTHYIITDDTQVLMEVVDFDVVELVAEKRAEITGHDARGEAIAAPNGGAA